ncbi:Na+/H+ antiporter [hydrothermal vent metagenome]|uniref:Na+/H+ antiporter n=1 Tax=hydrothermal vent metagenome TaxID=652676 RepID=A0A3B0WQD8_9ZZZZ
MLVERIILSLVVILGLSILAQPVSKWLRLPFASILVALGFVFSEIAVFVGIDTGIRADNFQAIIFYIFIPILVFESAYNLDKTQLKKNLIVVLSLAIITMLLTCLIAAALLFYGVGHESGFPWIAALITGAILATTDPVAVVVKLKKMKAPKRIAVLLEGESLFNDATAIVLFGVFLSVAAATSSTGLTEIDYSPIDIGARFLSIFIGGGMTGLIVGLSLGYLQRKINQCLMTGILSLVVAYGSYLLAEFFVVSGVMSTLLAALSFSIMVQKNTDLDGVSFSRQDAEIASNNKYLWDVLSHVANVSVFLVMGAVITVEMFEQRWLAMLIAIVSLLIARAISVYGVMFFFSFFKNLEVSLSSQTVMVWGGLRGAVTLALALSLPISLEYWWTIQSIAFGVVMFSLFVQAPTMSLLAKRLLKSD